MKFSLRHQSTGRIYPYLALTSPLMIRAFMRKVYVYNRQGIPSDKPVLLASNHPTAFLDPFVTGDLVFPPLYNMTRGDMFKNPFFRRLLEGLNMFPVYRLRDGYKGRNRNDEVFEFCSRKLFQKRVVNIYVEGEHHLEWRVKPLQKGIVMIAFNTMAKQELPDLEIIPTGCNYLYGDRPRDEVMLNIGEPIPVLPYWQEYRQNPQGAMNRLLADIETALKKVCLHVQNPADDALAAQMLTLCRSEYATPLLPIVEYHNRRFIMEKAVCDRINAMHETEKNALRARTDRYFNSLRAAGVYDDALVHPEWAAWSRLWLFVLGFLPFLAGYLSAFPIIWLAQYVTRKKVKKREFRSSVHMGVAYIGGLLYYLLLFLAGLFTWNPWWISLALALPALGWFSMFYRENWSRWINARKAIRHPDRARLLELRKQTGKEG